MTERATGELGSVLVVTGSDRTRRMYAEYFAWRGVEVREVDRAAAATHAIAASLPDVVVTDDRLPDGTGQALVRALRRSRHTFDLPVVVLSSDAFGMGDELPARMGCTRILTVPLLPESLFNALESLVDDCRTRRGMRPFESRLFVREDESVWMVRTADLELAVAGPGTGRGVYTFGGEHELLAFQAQYGQRLRHSGFELQAGGDRRHGYDRRTSLRQSTIDRRAVH